METNPRVQFFDFSSFEKIYFRESSCKAVQNKRLKPEEHLFYHGLSSKPSVDVRLDQ